VSFFWCGYYFSYHPMFKSIPFTSRQLNNNENAESLLSCERFTSQTSTYTRDAALRATTESAAPSCTTVGVSDRQVW
jgi:hypothetical protein